MLQMAIFPRGIQVFLVEDKTPYMLPPYSRITSVDYEAFWDRMRLFNNIADGWYLVDHVRLRGLYLGNKFSVASWKYHEYLGILYN